MLHSIAIVKGGGLPLRVLRLPTMSKINRLYDVSPFPSISQKILSVKGEPKGPTSSFDYFKRIIDLGEFVLQLHYRTVDAGRSFAHMQYFQRLGIPDDQWYMSPGRKGQSIEYLPHFKPIHRLIKDWFDYYADFFLPSGCFAYPRRLFP